MNGQTALFQQLTVMFVMFSYLFQLKYLSSVHIYQSLVNIVENLVMCHVFSSLRHVVHLLLIQSIPGTKMCNHLHEPVIYP